jgi:hypothetical protein
MIALIAAIFSASLLGSLHCAGMCGAFVAFAVGLDGASPVPRWRLHAAYNLGRLATYVILGTIAGSLGGAFDVAGRLVGVQRAAVVFAGLFMVAFGSIAILRQRGARVPKPATPRLVERLLTAAMRRAVERPPITRALLTGMTTTLMPCGWLYAFVVAAAGTAHPLHGAFAMACFWLGTLPVLIAVGAGVQALASRLGALGRHAPVVVSAAVVVVGLLNVVDPQRFRTSLAPPPERADPISHVESLDPYRMPCCHDDTATSTTPSPAR